MNMDSVRLATALLTPPALLGISLCAFVLAYLRSRAEWNARSRGFPLPPGPKPLPVVGNLFDWPKSNQSLAFRDLCTKYGMYSVQRAIDVRGTHLYVCAGDVLYLDVLGQRMITLGSSSAILELLDKRSANSSSRLGSNGLGSLYVLLVARECYFMAELVPLGPRWISTYPACHTAPGGDDTGVLSGRSSMQAPSPLTCQRSATVHTGSSTSC